MYTLATFETLFNVDRETVEKASELRESRQYFRVRSLTSVECHGDTTPRSKTDR